MASSCFEEHKPTLAMVAVQCIYVGMAMAGKAAVAEGFSPMVFVFYNQAIATLFMVPVTIFSRGGNVRQIVALGWKGFWLVFVTSLVGCTACMYFYYVGLDLSTPSVTTAMLNLIPGMTFVMAASTGLESVKLRSLKTMAKVLGTIICMGGAICMGLFKGPRLSSTMEFSTISGSPDKQWMIGCLSLLAAASCRSIWFILQVPICKSYLDPLSLATWMCFLSAILSAILTLFFIPDPRKWKITSILELCSCLFTITSIVVDYKYSLPNLPNDSISYRSKLSEVHLRSAKKLLKLCEANKGFYVKAGQFVSSLRQVPKEYTSTLSSLQDQAIPCNFKDIREVVVNNLGKDLSEVFLSFDEQPIAAASIAQVHRGLLKDEQAVAIKVQYPGLQQRMKIDITTMAILSKSVSWIFPSYRFDQVISEFEKAMHSELDFVQEAKNSERAAKNFKKNNVVRIPHVFWDLTTSQVLTMQYCSGHKVDDLDFLKESGINPIKVAKALMDVFAEMIFVHGFLHGDPHPGNILVSPEGPKGFSLVLLDHGMYRELDEMFRLEYCQLWKALILMDSQKILEIGDRFGVGKYSKYFPVIFTGRTIDSKSALGTQMSNEEKRHLKQELRSLKMEDISLFMEALPPDFLAILRTDGLLRSIVGKLGAPRRVRLLAYGKYAVYGLGTQTHNEHGLTVRSALSKISRVVSYLQLRTLIEILALLACMEELRYSLVNRLNRMLQEVISFFYETILIPLS